MIPAAFAYSRVTTLEEALDLVAGADPSVRVLAGGQSLIPLMKLRLARPERLVDVGRLSELRGIRDRPDGGLTIGALTTWAELLDDPRIREYGALADAIPIIGDVQVRNLGTIGGSLAHADPATTSRRRPSPWTSSSWPGLRRGASDRSRRATSSRGRSRPRSSRTRS